MKKIFIGLLILAAGAVVYYLLSQSKNITPVSEKKEALLLGKWKAGFPAEGRDSLLSGLQYEVLKDGTVLIRDSAAVNADSIYYEWNKSGDLLIREHVADSTADTFNVLLLTKDSLQLKNKDSKVYQFTRL